MVSCAENRSKSSGFLGVMDTTMVTKELWVA
jgi:hypothetical protein